MKRGTPLRLGGPPETSRRCPARGGTSHKIVQERSNRNLILQIAIARRAKGIKASILCQPYVSKVDIEIRPHNFDEKSLGKQHVYDYTVISGRNLIAEVEVHYHEWHVVGRVEWKNDLAYPLMYVKTIQKLPSQ